MIVDEGLARALVDAQFPQWRSLPIRQVVPGGWDNRTFRLGDDLLVRLPSEDGYAAAVAKEQRWLPVIGPLVPFEVPQPVAAGEPTSAFPRPWSVYRWLDGVPVTDGAARDLDRFARDTARFLVALSEVDTAGAPPPGDHNSWRGAHPIVYDDDVQRSLTQLEGVLSPGELRRARAVWDAARSTEITAPAVWFHGDIAHGNLLLREGDLAAVIDFGTSGVGDPACDLVISWTMFDDSARSFFRGALPWDDDVWARGRAWALWKAMLVLAGGAGSHDPAKEARAARSVIERVLTDAGG